MTDDAWEQVITETGFKEACLESCSEGFEMKRYLRDRAEASMETSLGSKKRKREKFEVSDEVFNPGLYKILKEWRNDKAEELGLPQYMLLQLKTMRALTNSIPKNTQELKKIHGFGKKRLEKYGDELLELLADYREHHDVVIDQTPGSRERKKRSESNTRQKTLELWKSHRDIEKIAAERGLAISTIEGHLADMVGDGNLDVKDFVEPAKLQSIIDFFNEHGDMPPGAARDHLGEQYTYRDLHFAKKHMVFQKSGDRS
jgi:uncharacterized protein YpbB